MRYNDLMENELTFPITADDDGKRIKDFLSGKGLSRRELSRLLQSRGITLNGEPAGLARALSEGDSLRIVLPQCDTAHAQRLSGKAEIVYEDEYLLVVNKPRGMAVHSSREHREDDLGTLLRKMYGKKFVMRVIGRLDKDAAGLVLCAKDQKTAAVLSAMKEENRVVKEYAALTEGVFEEKEGVLTYTLDKIANDKSYVGSPDGKPCVTRYAVQEEFAGYSLLSVWIDTGRTHQIRAGLSYYGHPIVGDKLYGGNTSFTDRVQLSAVRLSFPHPVTGKPIDVRIPLSKDTTDIIQRLDKWAI